MGIIDLIVILFIVIVAVLSARKGFLMSLFNLISYFISGILVKMFASPVSDYIYNTYASDILRSEIKQLLPSGSVDGNVFEVIEKTMSVLPSEITAIAKQFGIYPSESAFKDFAERYESFSVEMIEQRFIEPIVTGVISLIVIIVLFIFFAIILRIIFHFINAMLTKKNHPVIRNSNAFFGAALGVVKGTIYAGLMCVLLNIAAPILNNPTLNDATVNSYFCNLVADLLK